MRVLYNAFVLIYGWSVVLASFFSPKARAWRDGRRGLLRRMKAARTTEQKVAWFHCASLGEFEQGRPVIERFREEFPAYRVLLTFFSPSGYEVRKSYAGADEVFYLPLDTPSNVRRFLDTWKPSLAFFVKYEYWFNYLKGMRDRDIPVMIISAVFRPRQHFFRPWGGWFRKHLRGVHHFFVQNEQSAALLEQIGVKQVSLSGDTRFDRVASIAGLPRSFPLIEAFTSGSAVLVAGSTWPADNLLIAKLLREGPQGLKLVIAPHEISESGIRKMQEVFGCPSVRYTKLNHACDPANRVMIIDTIGMLSHIYQYGDMAYVGGGFGRGIHNILEAAVFGQPVFFGPNYSKFKEAIELKEKGGAFPVGDADSLLSSVQSLLDHPDSLQQASDASREYVRQNQGATQCIMQALKDLA